MTSEEIKSEIQKSLDKVPESILQNILDLLKTAENRADSDVSFAMNLNKILTEDRELLERLAK
jgi:hypothetical protein